MTTKPYAVGVDVGGTFTDIFVVDQVSGAVATTKLPSTLDNQSRGLVEGIAREIDDFGAIASVIHGTTTGTNALLERKGAVTGMITSAGFRDVLEMRRRDRPRTWGLRGDYTPVIRRDRRLEVAERTHADGTVVTAIDPQEVQIAARKLIEMGCTSVVVFFVNSYANDANERAAAEAVRAVWPNAYVTRATEILPEIREFERVSTAALNAYLQPVVSSYMDRLDAGLGARGFAGDLLIVQSNGGVMSVDTARAYPVRTALSGPAAGVRAAQAIAAAAQIGDIITCDLGGTSFDVSLIAGGEAALSAQTAIDFGMVVRTPMIEITTIGAGGGSIASIDAGGLLQVGPESAGSNPGPVCYGLGNDRPTLTDANLVLGRINAARPIGGKLDRLDLKAARAAIARSVGDPLGLSPERAAEAVLRVANAKMAGAIRLVSIERGHDPARFHAMPFGGGGALHVGALIADCGLRGALVPRYPGVTSALGCVVADMRHDRVRTVNRMLDDLDAPALGREMSAIAQELQTLLDRAGVAFAGVAQMFELDMLYLGQTHSVAVPLTLPPGGLTRDVIAAAFDAAYGAEFGRLLDNIPKRVMNLRVAVIGRRPPFDMRVFAPAEGRAAQECITGWRSVFVAGAWQEVPIYDRLSLAVDEAVAGPCVLEQPDTTIFVDPGLTGRCDAFGNLILEHQT
ncbi:hydantoin utilization protein A [Defluviimonas sp. 20V17]|uniref:Hydantoinase n=1 Tax=Allgaiera indica TaxID=765699 RepID=A0AAN4UST6_9RHOB|nr:hydantoinase/oxoprolinase family protein [Allgaiera indica]KDB01990.1 hydantoin utilization protein A [Defluviimonas sp. 20V17]GHE03245.1 hydantoinase [Allgaiera indica]SDX22244.1 N-methylhydantoinase A [Allgaiera indica]